MRPRHRNTSLGNGVYYAAEDYVGMGPRFAIFLIDLAILGALLVATLLVWSLIPGRPPIVLTVLFFAVTWFYVVFCKRWPLRTVGYWLLGCRLVDLQGERPSLFALTVRSLLWMFGPFNLLFDLMWCGIDDDKQTLRDRYAGTCLVRQRAVPIGKGEIHLTHFDIGTFNLMYPRVVHPQVELIEAERVPA